MKKRLSKNQITKTLNRELPRLRKKYGVVRFGLFGPYVKGTAGLTIVRK